MSLRRQPNASSHYRSLIAATAVLFTFSGAAGCLGSTSEEASATLCAESPSECARRFLKHWSNNYLRHVTYAAELNVVDVELEMRERVASSDGVISVYPVYFGSLACNPTLHVAALERVLIDSTGTAFLTPLADGSQTLRFCRDGQDVVCSWEDWADWPSVNVLEFFALPDSSPWWGARLELAGPNQSLAAVFEAVTFAESSSGWEDDVETEETGRIHSRAESPDSPTHSVPEISPDAAECGLSTELLEQLEAARR